MKLSTTSLPPATTGDIYNKLRSRKLLCVLNIAIILCVCVCVCLCKCVCNVFCLNFVQLTFARTLIYINSFFSIMCAMNNVYDTTGGKYH